MASSRRRRQLRRRVPSVLIGLLVVVTGTLCSFVPVAAATTGGWSVSKAYFVPIQPMAVACSTDQMCVAGGNGIVNTSNSGSTWVYGFEPSTTLQVGAISCTQGGALCVAAGSATTPYCCNAPLILRSTNSGKTWANVAVPSGAPFDLTGVSCPTTTACDPRIGRVPGLDEWRADLDSRAATR